MADGTDIVTQLLTGALEHLDLPGPMQDILEVTYDQVGVWMTDHLADGSWQLYPQGSGRLGTTVRPEGRDEYDIDSVAEWAVSKEHTTKENLKQVVGDALAGYVKKHTDDEKGAPIKLEPGRRCWTLEFREPFHMDVLPALPDPDKPPTGILITDRDLHHWQKSNPKGYADWFFRRSGLEFERRREALAKARDVTVDQVPAWRVKTTLQRTVQVLKAHRNSYFADDLEARPPSVLITTLIAHSYQGQSDLIDSVLSCAQLMPRFMKREDGVYVVANPSQPEENFAERFSTNAKAVTAFQPWLDDVQATLEAATTSRKGLDDVVAELGARFGQESVRQAAKEFGERTTAARVAGNMSVTPTGTIATTGAAGLAVKQHTFHGD